MKVSMHRRECRRCFQRCEQSKGTNAYRKSTSIYPSVRSIPQVAIPPRGVASSIHHNCWHLPVKWEDEERPDKRVLFCFEQ